MANRAQGAALLKKCVKISLITMVNKSTKKKIKIAVIGVGNCFSALYQGFAYYQANKNNSVSGIMFEDIGGYTPTDIEVVAAFDVDKRKVGKPIGEAIFALPN